MGVFDPPTPPKKGVLGGGLILRETAHGVVMEGGVNPHFWPFLAIFDPPSKRGVFGGVFGPPKKRHFSRKNVKKREKTQKNVIF